jgi:hypothetical protein
MKLTLLLSLAAAITGFGQDVAVSHDAAPKTPAEAKPAEERKLETPVKPKKSPEETVVTSSGFLVELARAEKKTRFLSLRQPLDVKNDYKYVHFDEKTGRPKGVVLFSLDF